MSDEKDNGHKKSLVVDNFGKDPDGNQVAEPKPGFIDEGPGGFKGYRKPEQTLAEIQHNLNSQDKVDDSIKEVDKLRNAPGSTQFLPHMDTRKTLECACKNTAFIVVVVPSIKTGSAQILTLYCLNPACRKGVIVSDTGGVGNKAALTVDSEGKKHHRIIAEGGKFFGRGF